MLIVSSLTKSYGRRTLWQGVDLRPPPGTMTALVGPSGSGKSTLLHCVGLLIQPDSGGISADGVDLLALGPGARRRFRRDHLGYLFQSYALIEDSSVRENLAVATRALPGRRRGGRPAMADALERVGLSGRLDDPVAELSGGEQQRVALARLLLREPTLVLADEPTGALDQANGERVVEHLRGIAEQGATVLIATHDDRVRAACDAVLDLALHADDETSKLTPV